MNQPDAANKRNAGSGVSSDDVKLVRELIEVWIEKRTDAAWMERHLAPHFRFTSFLLPQVIEKRQFIEIVSNTPAKLKVVSVAAEPVGPIIVSRLVLDVIDEVFTANLGPGMPTGAEIQKRIVGRRMVYVSAFVRGAAGWQCYDHHQIGPVD
jgi:hypothetical protein